MWAITAAFMIVNLKMTLKNDYVETVEQQALDPGDKAIERASCFSSENLSPSRRHSKDVN